MTIRGNELTSALRGHRDRLEGEAHRLRDAILDVDRDLEAMRREESDAWTAFALAQVERAPEALPAEVASILAEREASVAAARTRLAGSASAITGLEAQVAAAASAHEEAAGRRRERAEEIQADLNNDPAYVAAMAAARARSDASEAMSERHRRASEWSRGLMAGYESDEVFAYLLRRGCGDGRVPAWPFSRLDAWLAGVSGFDSKHGNYVRLARIPEWVGERLEAMRAEHGEAVAAAEAISDRAFVPLKPLLDAQSSAEEQLASARRALEAARRQARGDEEHLESVAMGRDAGHRRAVEAMATLVASSRRDALRAMAADTAGTEDDEALARAERIGDRRFEASARADGMRIELKRVRERLDGVREAEERLDRNGWDVSGHRFDTALGSTHAAALAAGMMTASDWFRRAEESHRAPPPEPGYGTTTIGGFAPPEPSPPPSREPTSSGGFGGSSGGWSTGGGFGGESGGNRSGGF